MVILKAEVDTLHIEKLIPVPLNFSKLRNLVKNDVLKKTVCDQLVAKVNSIDTKFETDK